MFVWELIAERKIQEAMDQGEFDRLSGKGEPISLDEDPYTDPSLRMAHRLLRNNGFAPRWVDERKDVEATIQNLRAAARRGMSEAQFRKEIARLNGLILACNLKSPQAAQMLTLDAGREWANSS